MRLTSRGYAVVFILSVVAVFGMLVMLTAAMIAGDDLRCERLMRDTHASDFTREYYCN